MVKINSRAQLGLIAGLIIILVVGLLFYYLSRSNDRLETDNNEFTSNDNFEVLDTSGNFVPLGLTQSDSVVQDQVPVRQISTNPIAGYRLIDNEFGNRLRYIESETGHVYDHYPETDSSTRLTNTSLPRITKATWLSDNHALLQYNEAGRNVNYLAEVQVGNGVVVGQIFPSDIISITGVKDGAGQTQIYYLLANQSGSSNLYRYNPETGESRFMQQLELGYLDLITDGDELSEKLYAVSKPNPNGSSQVIFEITSNGLDNRQVRTDFKPSSGVLISYSSLLLIGDGLESVIENRNNSQQSIISGSLLGAKCGNPSEIGDDFICAESALTSSQIKSWPFNWFKGQLSASEKLVSIDSEFGDKYELADLGNNYDVSQIQTTNNYIYFIGRNTDQLYEVFRGPTF